MLGTIILFHPHRKIKQADYNCKFYMQLIKSKRKKKFVFLANEEWTLIKKFIQIQIRSLFIENNIFLLIDDYLMAFIC